MDAIALKFNPDEDGAPVILVRGEGEFARIILDLAKSSDVPVISRPEVVGLLKRLPEGSEIPENLYRVVSSIYSYLYRLNEQTGEKKNN